MEKGWHDNPDGTESLRYFDGQQWTEQVEWLGKKPDPSQPAPVVAATPTPSAAEPVVQAQVQPASQAPPKAEAGSRKGLLGVLGVLLVVGALGAVLFVQLQRDSDPETASENNDRDQVVADADSDEGDLEDAEQIIVEDDSSEEVPTTVEEIPQSSPQFSEAEELEQPETASTTTTTASGPPACVAQFAGQETPANVSGVNDWVNGRSDAGLTSNVVSQVGAGEAVTAFVDHVVFVDSRSWVPILVAAQSSCVWVDMSFLKSGTRLLRNPSAASYVIRALNGLDADAAHANRVLSGPDGELSLIGNEQVRALEASVLTLRNLGSQFNDALIVDADLANTFNDSESGCSFNDIRVCRVLISNDSGLVASVDVVFAGNGVSEVFVQPAG